MHALLSYLYHFEAQKFEKALGNCEKVQRIMLQQILLTNNQSPWGQSQGLAKIKNYSDFTDHFPVTEYMDWHKVILQDKTNGVGHLNRTVTRYEATSGSTGARKWIPYTPLFLSEINRAAQTWIHDLYKSYPAVKSGKHFWSLSWIPDDLRKDQDSDDLNLFPWWQIPLLKKFMVMNPAIQNAPTSESAWHATKLLLCSTEDLTLLSVWSPSYALNLIYEIFRDRVQIAAMLKTKSWGIFSSELAAHTPCTRANFPSECADLETFVQMLWPKLVLISCWRAGPSSGLAAELADIFKKVSIQGKGLWATEGVVTFPWKDKYPLAIRSHFFEFRCLQTEKIFPAWELQMHQEVQPLITSSNGILRYALPDRIKVTEFFKQTPCFEFLGRMDGVDLVGEKVAYATASQIIVELNLQFPEAKITCLAASVSDAKAQYWVIGLGNLETAATIAYAAEEKLLKLHHYRIARELHQILPVKTQLFGDSLSQAQFLTRAEIKGQSKINSIIRI